MTSTTNGGRPRRARPRPRTRPGGRAITPTVPGSGGAAPTSAEPAASPAPILTVDGVAEAAVATDGLAVAPTPDQPVPDSPNSAPHPGKSPIKAPKRPKTPRLVDTAGPEPAAPPSQVRLMIGVISGPFGIEGEVKLRLTTDDPSHLPSLSQVFLGDEPRPRRLFGVRFHAGQALLRLQFVSTPEQATALRGLPVRIRGSDARPLAPDEVYLYQLIGLEVFDDAGTRLGRVTDLLETGANDVLVVSPDEGPDLLFPNLPDVVVAIRPEEGRVTVRPQVFYGE